MHQSHAPSLAMVLDVMPLGVYDSPLLRKQLAENALALDKVREDKAASENALRMENLEIKAKLAHLITLQQDGTTALNACQEDVAALTKFSQSSANDRGLVKLTQGQLAVANNKIRNLTSHIQVLRSAKTNAEPRAKIPREGKGVEPVEPVEAPEAISNAKVLAFEIDGVCLRGRL